MIRDYQEQCLADIVKEWEAGIENQLVVIPTAGGKTVIFSHLPQYLPFAPFGQMLVLVHRDKLVKQNAEKLRKYNPGLDVQIEAGADRADPLCDVIVGSVQTLQHAKRRDRFNPQSISCVVVDEAHHSISPSYIKILEYFGVFKGPSKENPSYRRAKGPILIGFTATPKRGDSIGLEKVFDKIVFARSIRDGVEGKWLVEPKGYRVTTSVDISHVGVSGGDFKDGELSNTVNILERNRLVVEQYQKLASGLSFACFTTDIKHSEDQADVFRSYGISCEAISGETPERERVELYRRHDSGELMGLCSCGVLSEGWDNPRCTVGLLCRPTKSSTLYIQQLGRVLRPFPSPEDLDAMRARGVTAEWIKQFAIIIDFCDQTGRHQVVTLPSLFGLRADFNLAGKGAISSRKRIDDLLRRTPGLDIDGLGTLEEIEAFVREVNLLGPIKIPSEVSKYSKFSWMRDGVDGYRLRLPDRMTTLYIQQNALGQWETSSSAEGKATVLFAGKLPDAFMAGDLAVPKEAIGAVFANAKWHKDPPTMGQCTCLFYKDGTLRRKYFDPFALFRFAKAQYESGNTEWSKGGLSARIDAVLAAKKAVTNG